MPRTLALSLVAVTVAVAVPATTAASSSAVNACSLVTAKQVASLGVTKPCKRITLPGSAGVISNGSWGSPVIPPAALVLSVNTFNNTNNPIWQASMKTLKIMAGGPAKKVTGIGDLAYEAGGTGGNVATVHFVKGKRIVAFSWYSTKPPRSLKTFTAIAKSIAGQV